MFGRFFVRRRVLDDLVRSFDNLMNYTKTLEAELHKTDPDWRSKKEGLHEPMVWLEEQGAVFAYTLVGKPVLVQFLNPEADVVEATVLRLEGERYRLSYDLPTGPALSWNHFDDLRLLRVCTLEEEKV